MPPRRSGRHPASLALDDAGYRLKAGHLDHTAHYLLIDDNLLDLRIFPSRTKRRSGWTCRNGLTSGRVSRPSSAGCISSAGWLTIAARLHEEATRRAGRCVQQLRLPVSGVFLQRTGFYRPGTAAESAGKAPQDAPLFWRIDEQRP